jgi:formylglycine-generating enzyme required for sulfatase activity
MTSTLHRTLIVIALVVSVLLAVVFSRGRDPWQTDLDFTATNPSARPQSEGVTQDAAKAPQRAIAPFNNEQARQHQEAWAAHLSLPVEFTNTIGMRFRLIPPGEFLMGSTLEEIEAELKRSDLIQHLHFWRTPIESEGPQHKVVLTKPIYVGVTEVTQAQYELVMGTNPSQFSSTGEGKEAVANLETGNYPVEMVSFNESVEFCARLSQHEHLEPFNILSDQTVTTLSGTGYRLPTEAEWEFACRAGTTTRFWSGDENENLIQAGWCSSNAGDRTHAAGELKANPFGLSDMHGNVWEWVHDGWDPKFYGQFQENIATDPFSPLSAGTMPMRRGGSFMQIPELVRSSSRLLYHTDAEMGFRVVLVAEGLRVSGPEASPQSNNRDQSEVSANALATPDRTL